MVRVKTAGGALTPGQFERLVALAEECGDGTLRLTMRQGLQLHGVRWGTVGELLERLETAALYSRGSCGNALRNVVCCPLAADDAAGRAARQLAAQLAQEFFPTADWLDYVIEQASDAADEAPAAGRPSESAPSHSSDSAPSFPVPHKWKIGVATATHNCVNVLSNDLALIVHIGDDRQVRLDCHVGGSTALRSGPRARSAALAQPLCQIPLAEAATLVRAIMRWHHLHGGRGPRPERRLKRVLGREGIASLRRFVYQALRTRLAGDWDAAAPPAYEVPWQLHEGWYHDSGGRATLVVPIPTGRLGIRPSEAHRPAAEHDRRQSAFRSRPESARAWLELTRHARWLRIAPGHSLVLGDVDAPQRGAVERWLREQLGWTSSHRAASPTRGGIQETPADSSATEQSPRLLVCVAHPSCPLAQGEAEGDYPVWEPWLALLAEPLGRLLGNGGWQRETAARAPLMALAGCENGCSHPLSVPLGLIARDRERLDVYLGGDGRRLGKRALQASEPQQLVAQLRWLADRFAPAASRDRRAAGTTERPLDYALAWLESEAGRLNFPWPLPADRLS
jgi:sulfite reductase (ferredoxin)